jgi:iron complex outermembrane receptor protein
MKSQLMKSTAGLALAMMAHCAPAMAQGAEPKVEAADIVVTAQRRKETAQSIPAALTALGSDQIARTGIANLGNIASQIPNFYFGSFGAVRPQLYIRGIGTRSFDPGSESSVGVFADDVYYGRSSGSFGAMKDVERIEVLRGPQGTLYGRNTIGGAINVITKAPTDHLTGDFEAGVSNYNGWNLFGAVGGPIAGEKVMARVALWTTQRDGYSTNLTTGNRFQGVDNTGGRIRVALKPVDGLKIDLGADFMVDGNKAAFAGFNQGTSTNPNAVFLPGLALTPSRQNRSMKAIWSMTRCSAGMHRHIRPRSTMRWMIFRSPRLRHCAISTAMTGANWKAPRSTCFSN